MAAALGAKVAPGPAKEIGYAPLSLTERRPRLAAGGAGGRPGAALAWRRIRAAGRAKRLAFTDVCPNQAFSLGDTALALQFHAEVEPASLEAWLIGHTVELGKAGLDPRDLRAQAARHGAATADAGKKLFGAWLDGVFA